MTKLLFLLASGSVLLAASAALAGEPVSLRSNALGHGGVVTLGDLFDGAAGSSATVVVARSAPGTQAVLDSGDVQRAAHAAGLDWDNTQGLRRIIVNIVAAPRTTSAGSSRTAHHLRAPAQVLVYAHNMMAGDVVAASDLEWSAEAVAADDTPHDAQAVIGKAARGPLRAGAAVTIHELVNPKVVRRNDMISVDFSSDGVTLSLIGKAMGDASAGDPIEVMNTSSKKIIQAIVVAPGRAVVGPAAEAVRANPIFRTAALP
ncbi:flagellar basal body P-ring formation chaperone FlgA [Caulobacter sp. S45]|uniref:flagellar basal body P-ring formation chaperone FlgA n=1 Tax=Caulobacter sp. S45 TaxID=1641861 RepID=UPI00131B5E66|nr:flagellar basal body P-ring formation chaperone FlgA [Caulobacter sp. S45]